MHARTALALAAVTIAACTPTYAFVPATNPTTSIYGYPAASYPIPPQAPRGDLRVASYGIEPLSPAAAPDESVGSLHIRIFVSNTSDQAWTIDTREQRAAFVGQEASAPAFATADPGASGPPVVTIAPNTSRFVDLFFLLPADMQTASALPEFQFTATVQTGAGPVSETTPFKRVETDGDSYGAYYYAGPYPGYGPWLYGYDYWDWPLVGFYGGYYPYRYGPYYAHGHWGAPGYYHGWYGGYHGGYHGGYPGGYHGHPGGYHGYPGGHPSGGGHGGHR